MLARKAKPTDDKIPGIIIHKIPFVSTILFLKWIIKATIAIGKNASKFMPWATFCSTERKIVKRGMRRVPPPIPIPPIIPPKIPKSINKKISIFPLNQKPNSPSKHNCNKNYSYDFSIQFTQKKRTNRPSNNKSSTNKSKHGPVERNSN